MNADLERTLNEMGPAYREVVARLKDAREIEGAVARRIPARAVAWRIAAAFLVLAGLAAIFVPRAIRSRPSDAAAYGAREYHQSIAEIVSSQRPDGSWQNVFLTRRNAEVLRACTDEPSRIAYKKAMRNLRLRGFL